MSGHPRVSAHKFAAIASKQPLTDAEGESTAGFDSRTAVRISGA